MKFSTDITFPDSWEDKYERDKLRRLGEEDIPDKNTRRLTEEDIPFLEVSMLKSTGLRVQIP
jgi:YD repeat-containing protein